MVTPVTSDVTITMLHYNSSDNCHSCHNCQTGSNPYSITVVIYSYKNCNRHNRYYKCGNGDKCDIVTTVKTAKAVTAVRTVTTVIAVATATAMSNYDYNSYSSNNS